MGKQEMKVCAKCKEEKPATPEFFVRNGLVLHSYCRPCYRIFRRVISEKNKERERETRRRWARNNQDKINEKSKKRPLKKHGISQEQFDAMLEFQKGCCAICGENRCYGNYDTLSIDHDHKTGVVRGLLCTSCNHGLGKFNDSIELLVSAVLYLSTGRYMNKLTEQGKTPLDIWLVDLIKQK